MEQYDECLLRPKGWKDDSKKNGAELSDEGQVDVRFGSGGHSEEWEVSRVRGQLRLRRFFDIDLTFNALTNSGEEPLGCAI